MKRVAIAVFLLISVSGLALGQPSSGYLALMSVDGTSCGITSPYIYNYYRVFVVPGPNGALGAEFKLEYPLNVVHIGSSTNPAVVGDSIGVPDMGVGLGFLECQTDTVWICEITCLILTLDTSTIEMVAYPGNDSVRVFDCNSEIDNTFGTPLKINQEVPCISCDVSPDSIDFGHVIIGHPAVNSTFEITNTGVWPLSGAAVESCPDYSILDASYFLLQGESQLVTVRFEPTSEGTHDCTTETGSDPCSDVVCTGVGLEPECQVDPTMIDFDVVEVGSSKDTTFTITYTGSGYITDTVRVSCSHYSIVSDSSYYLGTGEWKDFTLRFEPTSAGAHPCTIETGHSICADIICTGFGCPSGRLYVDADAGGAGDGSTWLNAYTDLQSALGVAGAYPGCPVEIFEIWVAEGVYRPTDGTERVSSFQLQNDMALYGGFAGGETSLGQRDWAANETVLSGDIGTPGVSTDNSYHVVTGTGTDSTAVIDGFTITKGYAHGSGSDLYGGGMFNEGGSPTVSNVVFSDNFAYNGGGGMRNQAGSNPKLFNVVFTRNTTYISQSGGGGMANNYSDPTLTNVTFTDNDAGNGYGGGIANYQSDPTLVNTILWGNSAPAGQNNEINNNESTTYIDHSLVEGGLTSGCVDGGNNIDADPRFVDATNGNLRLWSSSPAIEAGNNTAVAGVSTDLDGNPRTYGAYVDMGAYEYQGSPTGIDEEPRDGLPRTTALRAVYPNPFNPTLTVEFDLDRQRAVQITIYDVGGRLVRGLVDEVRGPGTYKVLWHGRDDAGNSVATGVYFLRLRSEEYTVLRKIVLLK